MQPMPPIFAFLPAMVAIAVGLVMLIIWLFVCFWVYKDANKRGENGVLWALIVLVLGIIGLIIYFLLVRSKKPAPPPPPV
ncbi:MAG: PLDc N-terminal domain-containing protein [Thermoproteales archaeon]|nr:PLDc N-terminal domain-containing protein [Thermoproteales archaeon]